MAKDIIDTLHPEGSLSDNFYPNIKTANIPDGAISADKIQNRTITGSKIAEGAISTSKIANGAISADKIQNWTITGSKIADGAITGDKIADGSVTNIQIGAAEITVDKLDSDVYTTFVTTGSDQTIAGQKTFTAHIKNDEIDNTNGNAMLRYKSAENKVVLGGSTIPTTIMGSADRPTYSKNGSDFSGKSLALKTDVDIEALERESQDEELKRDIDKKANTTDLDTLKSSVNSNWSTLMANLGIGRWANQTLYTQYGWTNVIYDDLMPYYADYNRTFAESKFDNFQEQHASSTLKFSCQFVSPQDNKKSFMGTFYKTKFTTRDIKTAQIDLHNQDIFMGDCEFTWFGSDITNIQFVNGVAYFGSCFLTFNSCPNLKSIDGVDFTYQKFDWTGAANTFRNSPELKHLGIKHIHLSMTISYSTAYEEADLVEIISNLDEVTTTQTLTMGATNLAKLTDEEKKVATDKGWVLA